MKAVYALPVLLASSFVAMAQNTVQSSYYDNHGNGSAYTPSGGFVKSKGSNCAASSASCKPSMLQAITKGNVLVVYSQAYSAAGGTTLTSVSGEGSVPCPQCTVDTGGVTLDFRVVTSANGGETSISCGLAHASKGYQGCGVIELTAPPAGSTVSIDTGASQSIYCGNVCSGISLNTSALGVIIQTIFPDYDYATGVSYPYQEVCGSNGSSPNCSGVGAAVAQTISTGIQQPPAWNVGSYEPVQMNAIALMFGAKAPPPPPQGHWSFVQTGFYQNQGVAGGPGGTNCGNANVPNTGSSSCTAFAAQPITPGNLLIVYSQNLSDEVSNLTAVSEEPGTVNCVQCSQNNYIGYCGICGPGSTSMPNVGVFENNIMYVISSKGGENTITCNYPHGITWWWEGCGFVEAHWSGPGKPTFDTGGVRVNFGTCPQICHGVDLNLNGNDDFIFQINEPFWQAPISAGPTPPWVNIYGAAIQLDATSGIGPDWIMTAGDCCTGNVAIAFTGH